MRLINIILPYPDQSARQFVELEETCQAAPVSILGDSRDRHQQQSRGRNDHFYFDLRSYPRSLIKN
jgi:hypothetical protein